MPSRIRCASNSALQFAGYVQTVDARHATSEIKHPGGIDMARKGALDISRAAKVFGFRPRYDLRAGLEAYVRGQRRLVEWQRP